MTLAKTRLLIALSTLGIVGPVIFVAAIFVAGAVRPGYSAIGTAISALGTGANGWQEDVPALILGVCLLGFVVAFVWSMTGVVRRSVVAWSATMLALLALVWITVSVFTSAPATRGVHTAASLIGELAAVAALAIVGFGLRRQAPWKTESRVSLIAAAVSLAALIVTFATSQRRLSESLQLGGLFERILVVVVLAWCAYFAIRQIQHARLNQAA
jgi:hypothetical membrane protein